MTAPTLNRDFILSDSARKLPAMHHPWRRLRDVLPDWQVVLRSLPVGLLGATDTDRRTILLDSRMLQVQRRCTLDHELAHAEAGDVGCQHRHRETAINQASARRLVPIDRLLEVIVWANGLAELADECWVDVETMRCRMQHLHPAERAAVNRALASRDNEESP